MNTVQLDLLKEVLLTQPDGTCIKFYPVDTEPCVVLEKINGEIFTFWGAHGDHSEYWKRKKNPGHYERFDQETLTDGHNTIPNPWLNFKI